MLLRSIMLSAFVCPSLSCRALAVFVPHFSTSYCSLYVLQNLTVSVWRVFVDGVVAFGTGMFILGLQSL
jgi:hypothetical protein